jgi:hypothetical protein
VLAFVVIVSDADVGLFATRNEFIAAAGCRYLLQACAALLGDNSLM